MHLSIRLTYPYGKDERRDLSVIFDPLNKHYFWSLAPYPAPATGVFVSANASQKEAIYADPSGLVDFRFNGNLWIKLWPSQADSLNAAETASMNEIKARLPDLAQGYKPRTGPALQWPWDGTEVDLNRIIGPDFHCAPLHSICQPVPSTIESITSQNGQLMIVLRSRWDEEVVVDRNFTLVSARQLTRPK